LVFNIWKRAGLAYALVANFFVAWLAIEVVPFYAVDSFNFVDAMEGVCWRVLARRKRVGAGFYYEFAVYDFYQRNSVAGASVYALLVFVFIARLANNCVVGNSDSVFYFVEAVEGVFWWILATWDWVNAVALVFNIWRFTIKGVLGRSADRKCEKQYAENENKNFFHK
jgi:hypothetical protein